MTQPSSPEHGSNPSGISFDVQDPELIYKAVAQGGKGEIARTMLEAPIVSVRIELESDASNFDFKATFDFGINSILSGQDRIRPITLAEDVASHFNKDREVQERGKRYLTQGNHGTKLAIGSDSGSSGRLIISTGKMPDLGLEEYQPVPSPEVDEESFNNALQDIMDTITIVADMAYDKVGKPTPKEKITIAPPKPSVPVGYDSSISTERLASKIEVERPNIGFDEIGGQEEAKREIEGLAFALSNPGLYEKWGTKPPKGILLYGPPGTGKTLLAKALASQANARFFHIKASDIGSKWYGESEQIVQQVFNAASSGSGKTIIYFDEIDSIVPNREGIHEATQRVIGTLLQNIDGIGASDNVMLVASTNRMRSIDPAMMRPGRLDRLVEVGLPDKQGREHTLAIHLDKVCALAGRELFNKLNTELIAEESVGFSGADIAEIVRRTLEEKVRQEGRGQEPTLVTTDDLLRELQNYERVRKSKPNEQPAVGQ